MVDPIWFNFYFKPFFLMSVYYIWVFLFHILFLWSSLLVVFSVLLLYGSVISCFCFFLHQRSYFLYLDAWLHFNWMSEHCYNIVGSRFCCITLTNTRCILTYSSVALETLQFFSVFCTMSNRNSETDVGAQPEGKKSETSSYWLLPLS